MKRNEEIESLMNEISGKANEVGLVCTVLTFAEEKLEEQPMPEDKIDKVSIQGALWALDLSIKELNRLSESIEDAAGKVKEFMEKQVKA